MIKVSGIKSIVACHHIVMVLIHWRVERLNGTFIVIHDLFPVREGKNDKNLAFGKAILVGRVFS